MNPSVSHTNHQEQALMAAFHHYLDCFLRQRDGDAAAKLASPAITGFGTGADEQVYDAATAAQLYARDVAEQPSPIESTLKRHQIAYLSQGVGIIMGEMDWHMTIQDQAVSLFDIRFTLVFEETTCRQWLLVHKHLSQPTTAHGPDEGYPLREIESRSAVLARLVKARTRELEQTHQRLRHLAITDALTGLYNRVRTDEFLDDALRQRQRHISPLSVLLMDIDHFKQVNDQFGHHRGDDVLIAVSHLLSSRSRDSDCLGRWGGEEFLLICPDTTEAEARQLAEGLRKRVATNDFGLQQPLTISIGISSFQAGDTRDTLIARADQAMYQAKQQGRNRVCSQPGQA